MNKDWEVVYYVTSSGDIPVRIFLDKAPVQLKAKAFRIFQNINEYGLSAIVSHTKKLSGTPLWEIRILGKNNARILFATEIKDQVVLLHGFYKKTQKTPSKEIKIALVRLEDYKSSH